MRSRPSSFETLLTKVVKNMNRFFRPSDDASLEDSEQSATGYFVMMQTLRNY